MYTIEILEVGTNFGCVGIIRKDDAEIVYQSRIYPHGFDATARTDAECEAAERGIVVDEP